MQTVIIITEITGTVVLKATTVISGRTTVMQGTAVITITAV